MRSKGTLTATAAAAVCAETAVSTTCLHLDATAVSPLCPTRQNDDAATELTWNLLKKPIGRRGYTMCTHSSSTSRSALSVSSGWVSVSDFYTYIRSTYIYPLTPTAKYSNMIHGAASTCNSDLILWFDLI